MRIFTGLLTLMLLAAWSFAGEVKVAVAANVQSAFSDLVKVFNESNPSITIVPTFGASGAFTTQIKNGAPFDIFVAADVGFPQELVKAGLSANEPKVYAQGAVALFGKSADLSKGLKVVLDPSVEKIAIANPKTAPYGRASEEALKNAGYLGRSQDKFVYGKSIGDALSLAIADANLGFVAKSAFYSPEMAEYKEGVHWISVDPKLYTPIEQAAIILKDAANNKEAKAFYDFLFTKKAKDVFVGYGYNVPK
ncbi:MAG: molybdate ABC transporter substrate-binding protein [Campylobacteraceae bacterium]|jgi:molybdate transport system substrate-binding protein|nr:molybdate ABC transporter substrate-binding protein [Campylobacteraceae bacterium]